MINTAQRTQFSFLQKTVAVLGRTDSSNNRRYVAHALKAHSKASHSTWVLTRAQITSLSFSEPLGTKQRSNKQSPLNDHLSGRGCRWSLIHVF